MPTVPLSGTNIRLLSGVPFSNDYKHTRWFDTLSQQTTYFSGKIVVHAMDEANFQRVENNTGRTFISVNKSIDELYGTNYLMFQNAQYNMKWFYGFVTKLEYKNRATTYVHFELDVFQTWKFEMNFKPSYVVREHCQLWNTDGTPVINTVDEGLDYGTDYEFKYVQQYTPNSALMFLVIVAKAGLHKIDGTNFGIMRSSMNGSAQPLCYYIHPFDIFGQTPPFYLNGTLQNDLPDVLELMNTIYTQTNAVDNIVSLYITEHVGLDFEYTGGNLFANTSGYQTLEVVNVSNTSTPMNSIFVNNVFVYSQTEMETRSKYLDFGGINNAGVWSFPDYDESKLLMYPYSVIIMDDFKGNRITLRPEYINGETLNISVMGSLGLSNKVAYIPTNYLTDNISSSVDRTFVALENALIDNSPHDVTIINDMLAAFLQGNKNSLMNQANSIMFNGLMSGINGAIGGGASLASRNPVGMLSAATDTVSGAGHAALQMQGLQAKIKDISNVPPSVSKLGSNTAFEYGNTYTGFWLITKTIKPEYRKKLSDFFKVFGYKVNEVKTPNFHTRQNWNYVQTLSCNITGNFNNEDLQELKNIFDNGITLWHTDDVGNYSLSNGVI